MKTVLIWVAFVALPAFAAEESKAERARERFEALDADQSGD